MCLTHLTMSKLLYASGLIDEATAPYGNNGDAYVMSGTNQWGIPFTDMLAYPLTCEGGGARHNADGVDAWGFPWGPWGRGPDVEEEEDERPHIHLFQKILKDSCGHGKFRGGAGITVGWMVKGVPQAIYQSIVKSSRVQGLQSFFGGYPPPTHPGIQLRGTGLLARMAQGPSKIPTDVYELVRDPSLKDSCEVSTNLRKALSFREGDVFVGCSHGGVGYGDVLERDPQLVVEDLGKGIISDWVAREIYRVAYDPVTMAVNHQETEKQRQRARKERLAGGQRYEQFASQWSSRKPPESILAYYGAWPDAELSQKKEDASEDFFP